MKRKQYNVYEFEWQVEEANAEYEQGRENKAFRILRKALCHFDEDIPAYVYFRYYDMWKEFEELYEVYHGIAKMSDEELVENVNDALNGNRHERIMANSFQKDARKIFNRYLDGNISNKVLYNKIYALERQELSNPVYTDFFVREMIAIFRAYFYGRDTIAYEIADIYKKFLRDFFICETYESVLKKRINKRIKENKNWPEAVKCAIKLHGTSKKWAYIYIDPSIPDDAVSKNDNYTEGKNLLAMFKSMIVFESGERGVCIYHNGCKIISNWNSLTERYPKLAEQFVRIGSRYFKARQEYIRKTKLEQERKMLDIPLSERKKIVQIWNKWDKKLIKIVD